MRRKKTNEDNILFYNSCKEKQKEFTAATFLQFRMSKAQQELQKKKMKKQSDFEHVFLKYAKISKEINWEK